ncbi:MAG: homoserine kinase [Geminicoccaceae bacterium]|nr:homoserine kinase [Geminicoccaceae bacterium]
MAVYTHIDEDQLDTLLAGFELGEVKALKGIAEGVENSNFFLLTESGRYILTIYEKRVDPADLPFFLSLMDHLSHKGVRCPVPIRDRNGEALQEIAGKPAAIITFLDGQSPRAMTPARCEALGRVLAELHAAGQDFAMRRVNVLSVDGWRTLFARSRESGKGVEKALAAEIDAELAFLEREWPRELPSGVIHADLFPDNVFFDRNRVSGLIDFYFACTDLFAYDVAICINAWCFEISGEFNITKSRALLRGYRERREMTEDEIGALPVLLRGAAMRFLLTRLHDWLNQVDGALVKPKNPDEYLRKLRFHQRLDGPQAYGV